MSDRCCWNVTNEDDMIDKLNDLLHRGPSKPCWSSVIKGRRSQLDRASSKLVEAGSIESRGSSLRLGRSSLAGAR